jgi:hypothetical protein
MKEGEEEVFGSVDSNVPFLENHMQISRLSSNKVEQL